MPMMGPVSDVPPPWLELLLDAAVVDEDAPEVVVVDGPLKDELPELYTDCILV